LEVCINVEAIEMFYFVDEIILNSLREKTKGKGEVCEEVRICIVTNLPSDVLHLFED
jgi:hypothetical protein